MSTNQADSQQSVELTRQSISGERQPLLSKRNTTRLAIISLLLFSFVMVYYLGFASGVYYASRHQTPAVPSASEYSYPALAVSNPPETPQAGLPYTARSVYGAILASGQKTHDVKYTNGWLCCVSYEPEGKMVFWSDTYELDVVEIAVFATPAEARQVASDLIKNSAGFSALSQNLCLFYYRSSISKEHIAKYMTVINQVCQ
ncbi:hypothetical protein [Ktedonobacter racemifer]|uniref:Uncharacterized protein n=1 Tax=Ktedonobacter racemifer DSM 44963 TaxID=485913 RepID=D6U7Q4_KTERA|nr:hypothetical protein [Ktedonobacter racemifer]EFH79915.1 hypothetical protein Krac_0440 [Ktedonobacter racemifer DSM 44963]